MKFYKRIFKNNFSQNVISWTAAQYLKLVYHTSQWSFQGQEFIEEYVNQGKPCIIAFWHNRLMMQPFAWVFDKPFYMLISSHSDGILISKTVSHFNIQTITGSTSKGGIAAFKSIIDALKRGAYIGITPDGPRGPRFIASEGIINIARLAKCDIIPLCYNLSNNKVLRSWDRFIIPLPFSRGVFSWGKPFKFQDHDFKNNVEKARLDFTQHMQNLADQVDGQCNQELMR